ncbi:uncharacterized protein LOC131547698 isoform X3 [Onychostoma macrolepis]|uniref:uncharacterized protein LOC131547698 isoform X3 n=1 Tax=Onychostoma macrolepis TaxID=369639 RepID=UPI00272CA8D7|nr:uncharacterized protein LOC131547698 isoform X3 [Onychostoma macrolepis]
MISGLFLVTAQLMSEHEAQNEIIDLTDECSACFEKPGPSFSDNARSPLKKKKRNVACIIPNLREDLHKDTGSEADISDNDGDVENEIIPDTGSEADISDIDGENEIIQDRHTRRTDDVANWTETQLQEWERSSWSGDGENRTRERGRQTPFAFQHGEEEEQQTGDQSANRYLIRTVIDRLDSQREEIYNKLNEQHAAIYNKINEQHAAICTTLSAYFNEIHIRLNRQDNEIREIKEVLYQQNQVSEARLHGLQAHVLENFASGHNALQLQLRERTLIVNLLCSINSSLQHR